MFATSTNNPEDQERYAQFTHEYALGKADNNNYYYFIFPSTYCY